MVENVPKISFNKLKEMGEIASFDGDDSELDSIIEESEDDVYENNIKEGNNHNGNNIRMVTK